MSKPKSQHFVPVGHLARFSASPATVAPRYRSLEVFDKRSRTYRRARCGTVAVENDLYTFRLPQLTGLPAVADHLVRAVFEARNKDTEVEDAKIDIEMNGLAAIMHAETWPVGSRELSEEERARLLAYIGLLIVQHPTMMRARWAIVRARLWRTVERRLGRPDWAERVMGEMTRGGAALALAEDSLETGLELNYMTMKLIRRTGPPYFVLGDTGVVAAYGDGLLGAGDVWTPGATFHVPFSPTALLMIGGFAPGLCMVEEHTAGENDAFVHAANVLTWARAAGQVFAPTRIGLEEVAQHLGPIDPSTDHSAQFVVRESVLPEFELTERDEFHIRQPTQRPDGGLTAARFRERFGGTTTPQSG